MYSKEALFAFKRSLVCEAKKPSLKGDINPAENEAFAKLKNKHAAFAARHEKGNRIVRQIVMIFQVNAVAVYVVVGCRSSLFDDSKFLAYLDESSDCLVKLLMCVSGRELYADASLALRHNGIVEAGDINALFKQTVGITL